MKNKLLMRGGLRVGPERTTLLELVGEAARGVSAFAYVYPYAAVRGRAAEFGRSLGEEWKLRGFVVAACRSTRTAIRNIRHGEAWIIWDQNKGSPSLRVLVMRSGLHPGQ